MNQQAAPTASPRQQEIVDRFFSVVDKNLTDLLEGKTGRMLEVGEMADVLHIHATHLSNTIKEVTGKSPCFFYEERILRVAKKLLGDPSLAIGEVAARLTYDPSNFTKFFKSYEGITPKKYRQQLKVVKQLGIKSETLTI